MASKRNAIEIQSRFEAEQDYIARFASFLQIKCRLHDQQISELNTILHEHRLLVIPTRRFDRIGLPFNDEEIANVGGVSDMVSAGTMKKMLDLQGRLERLPKNDPSEPSLENSGLFSEWVEFLLSNYSHEDIQAGSNDLRERIFEEAQHRALDDEIPWSESQQIISDALEAAKGASLERQIDGLQYVLEQVRFLHVHARIVQPDAEINYLRQAFLLLMTAFDAAVFDLVRSALHSRFFDLIGKFARKDSKLTLAKLSSYGNIEHATVQIIEEELKWFYVKDLLTKLSDDCAVECIDRRAGYNFAQLIELVQRRNLHVHNRGYVDEKYLESGGNTQKPRYNLFNLALGDPAVIDEHYWETANKLCKTCVQRIAAWANN